MGPGTNLDGIPAEDRGFLCLAVVIDACSRKALGWDLADHLRTSGLLISMGRVCSSFDNAMAETFFATLKTELVDPRSWLTRHELEMEVFSYPEGFYNPRRRHSRLDDLSPTDSMEPAAHQRRPPDGRRFTSGTIAVTV